MIYLADLAVTLTATPITLWAVTALSDRRHTRHDDHRRELAAIDEWLDAIRKTA